MLAAAFNRTLRLQRPTAPAPGLLALLLLGLLVQALIPRGYMPAPNAGPGRLILCPAQGAPLSSGAQEPDLAHAVTHQHPATELDNRLPGSHAAADSTHSDHSGHASATHDTLCPFATAPIADHIEFNPHPTSGVTSTRLPPPPRSDRASRSAAHPPLPARGPPHYPHV